MFTAMSLLQHGSDGKGQHEVVQGTVDVQTSPHQLANYDVSFVDIQPCSISVSWKPPDTGNFPIYGYRLSVRAVDLGGGFKVLIDNTGTDDPSATLVGLIPDTKYDVHISVLSAENMAIHSASITSQTVTTASARYEVAWFFNRPDDEKDWAVYEGHGTDASSNIEALFRAEAVQATIAPAGVCRTGLRSLEVSVPEGYRGGVCTDTPVQDSKRYRVTAWVRHTTADAQGDTRLMLWDLQGPCQLSKPAKGIAGEWEMLSCDVVTYRSSTLRIALEFGPEYCGLVHIDSIEVALGGPTEAEIALNELTSVIGSLESVTLESMLSASIKIESASEYRAADLAGTSDPFVRVLWGSEEVGKTRVIPMTMTAVWNETFSLQCPPSMNTPLRLELLDYNVAGKNEMLGYVEMEVSELMRLAPHRHCLTLQDDSPRRSKWMARKTGAGSLFITPLCFSPANKSSPMGRLVVSAVLVGGEPLQSRLKALQGLADLVQRGNSIKNEAKTLSLKAEALNERVMEAAIACIDDEILHSTAVLILKELMALPRCFTSHGKLAFEVRRALQRRALRVEPVVPLSNCLKNGVGDAEELLCLLADLYLGQQRILWRDAAANPELFAAMATKAEASQHARSLFKEMTGGHAPLPCGVQRLYKKHGKSLPLLPGVWRPEMLKAAWAEDDSVSQQSEENSEASAHGSSKMSTLVLFAALPTTCMAVAGVGLSSRECDRPVALLMAVDGILTTLTLIAAYVFMKRSQKGAVGHRMSLAFFPALLFSAFVHFVLYILLLVSLQVDSCDAALRGWGVFFAIVMACETAAPPLTTLLRAGRHEKRAASKYQDDPAKARRRKTGSQSKIIATADASQLA